MQRLYNPDRQVIAEDITILTTYRVELEKLIEQNKINQVTILNMRKQYTFLENLADFNLLLENGYRYENMDLLPAGFLTSHTDYYYQGEVSRDQVWAFSGSDQSLSYSVVYNDRCCNLGFYLGNGKMISSDVYDVKNRIPLYLEYLARPILLNRLLADPSFISKIMALRTRADLQKLMYDEFDAVSYVTEEERISSCQYCFKQFHL